MRVVVFLMMWISTPLLAANWVVSIEPLAMVAREILGDQAEVQTLLLPNQTPHFAAFTPAQLQQVRDADTVVWLGAEAEPQLQKMLSRARGDALALLSLPGIVRRDGERAEGHQHDEHGHDHDGLDPHLWLSADNLIALAQAICTHAIDAGLASAPLQQRRDRLVQALTDWKTQARAQLMPRQQRVWLSQHDPWGYLTETLGVHAPLRVSAGLQGGTSSRHFAELMTQVRAQSVQCVVREPEAQRALLTRLCPDCVAVDLDPLGRDRHYDSVVAFLQALTEGFSRCLATVGD